MIEIAEDGIKTISHNPSALALIRTTIETIGNPSNTDEEYALKQLSNVAKGLEIAERNARDREKEAMRQASRFLAPNYRH